MIRAISVFCLSVILATGGLAHAGNKRTIAVLGLEVGGTVDQATTDAARELTKKLREKVNSGTSSYTMAGGSDKELLDLKLLNSCDSEAPTCMKKIADDLGANVLLYGRLERSGTNYKVTLKLFDAASPTASQKPTTDVIAVASLSSKGNDSLQFAYKMYGAVTGEASKVTLTLHIIGSDKGTVYVGGREAGHYTSGTYKLTTDEGKVKVAIEPDEKGAQRWEDSFQVSSTDVNKDIKITSTALPPPNDGHDNGQGPSGTEQKHEYGGTISQTPNSGWRKAFWVSTAASVAISTVIIYGGYQQALADGPSGSTFSISHGSANCQISGSTITGSMGISDKTCKDADKWHTTDNILYGGLAVVGGFALFALYKGYLSGSSEESPKEHQVVGRRKHRDHFAITPVISPTGAGATVQLDW